MADATRFTVLAERGPNNPPPGSESWRVVPLAAGGRARLLTAAESPPDTPTTRPTGAAVPPVDEPAKPVTP
jgi:hypothetical protein